jgi:hypothetical protein
LRVGGQRGKTEKCHKQGCARSLQWGNHEVDFLMPGQYAASTVRVVRGPASGIPARLVWTGGLAGLFCSSASNLRGEDWASEIDAGRILKVSYLQQSERLIS